MFCNLLDQLRILLLSRRELGNYKEALKSLNVSLGIDPSHLLTVRLRGSLHYHSGETQEALNDFNVRYLPI